MLSHQIISSRLPAQDWFTLDDVARYSGWSRNYIRDRVKSQKLAAQIHKHRDASSNYSYRVHRDDLIVFIAGHSNKRFTDEIIAADIVKIVRRWPRGIQKALIICLEKSLN